MCIRVVLITDLSQWSNWGNQWDDLLSNSTAFETRIFLSREWLTTWWQYFGDPPTWKLNGSGRGRLFIVAVVHGTHLLAAAPLFVAPSPILPLARIVRFIGNGNADYGDFLVRKGSEEATQLIWNWLFEHHSLWDIIALHEVPETGEAISSLKRVEIPRGIQASVLVGEACHRLNLNRLDRSWRERAKKSLREQLKRRERQIQRNFKVEFKIASNDEEVETAISQLFALHRLRWAQLGQTGVFISPRVQKFHREFAKQALKRNWLRLYWLTLDGVTAAAYYAFMIDNYSGFYTCGFHPSFSRYSVGKVLLAKVIDDAEREGAKVFDFMRGNETYKSDFGTTVQKNLHIFIWQEDKFLSRCASLYHQFATKLSLWLKKRFQR